MLRNTVIILFVGFIAFGLGGGLYAADTLESAIEKEAKYIISKTPGGTVLAIVSIKCDSGLLSDYIIERIPDHIIENTKNITIVTRSQLDVIQKEIDFQYSGEVSDETMVSIGKKIGAQIIVTGTIMPAGMVYNFSLKILQVESAQILGSNSVQIVHDEVMDGFMSDSAVAERIMADAQKKRQQRETTVTAVKNVLGIFSNGFYVGYLGSLAMPAGLSLGWLSEGASLFLDTGFGPPAFKGLEHLDGAAPHGYSAGNGQTAFLWDIMAGLNINLIKTVLWLDIAGGAQYRQNYQQYTNGSHQRWIGDSAGGQWKGVVSAGLFVKIWYFYVQGKYKYVIKDEINFESYGLNHVSVGAGLVLRR